MKRLMIWGIKYHTKCVVDGMFIDTIIMAAKLRTYLGTMMSLYKLEFAKVITTPLINSSGWLKGNPRNVNKLSLAFRSQRPHYNERVRFIIHERETHLINTGFK